jgi:hypothetical protein
VEGEGDLAGEELSAPRGSESSSEIEQPEQHWPWSQSAGARPRDDPLEGVGHGGDGDELRPIIAARRRLRVRNERRVIGSMAAFLEIAEFGLRNADCRTAWRGAGDGGLGLARSVHGAGDAGVEGADHAGGLDGLRGIGDGGADEGVLERAGAAVVVAGRAVPGRGDDALVVGDPVLADLDPVAECAAGGLGEADAGGGGGDLEVDAGGAVGLELVEPGGAAVDEDLRFDGARAWRPSTESRSAGVRPVVLRSESTAVFTAGVRPSR